MSTLPLSITSEPGSFRDRSGHIFYSDGRVLRTLDHESAGNWQALTRTRFFPRRVLEGTIIPTREAPSELSSQLLNDRMVSVLEHERVPVITYAYEWPFSMLKDAALLQLDLLLDALDENFSLKDATTQNVQWRGANPVFIDIPSFEPYRDGEPWIGYKQFCEMFLNPLLLTAHRGLPYHNILRGSLDGVEVSDMARLFTWRDTFRPGVLKHVLLHNLLQRQLSATKSDVKRDLKASGFSKELILANVRGLKALIQKLEWKQASSTWSEYTKTLSYTDAQLEEKKAFVEAVCGERARPVVLDIGCNTGFFSRLAADHGSYVVSSDIDALSIERLYCSLKSEGRKNILPLVMNVLNPSPGVGWRNSERKQFVQRVRPNLTLALALIHHVVISGNVPLREFLEWLHELTDELVIEFVERSDDMVQTLLRNKTDKYWDYNREYFESVLNELFVVQRSQPLKEGHRRIYYCVKR